MSNRIENIKLEIEQVFASLDPGGNEIIPLIRPILENNLKRGRVEYFIGNDLGRVREYVKRVMGIYQRLNPLIHELTVDKRSDVWEPLVSKMQKWAYNFFLGKNFHSGKNTQEIAEQCATDAAISMLQAYFPYDTDFDSWAYVILVHACQKYIRRGMTGILEQNIVELDEKLASEDSVIQNFNKGPSDLLTVLAKIPAQRRQVIELLYFEGLPPAEVAKQMNKTAGAIYSLHFHALADLQKILTEATDNDYE